MKLAASLALLAGLSLNPAVVQEPPVVLERSDDGGASWRGVFSRPVSSGWLGIAVRDTVTGTVQLYRVRWPLQACTSNGYRIGE